MEELIKEIKADILEDVGTLLTKKLDKIPRQIKIESKETDLIDLKAQIEDSLKESSQNIKDWDGKEFSVLRIEEQGYYRALIDFSEMLKHI